MVAAWRQHQRCELPQQDRNLRRGRGAQRRGYREDAGLCARQQALGHDRRRAPQHGRAGLPQGRHRARHARLQQDRAQREFAIGHGAAGRDLARHPERAASALCGSRHAVDRHLQRRRLDLGQRPRHGPSGRRAREVDQVDEGDAGRRLAADGIGDREQGSVQPRGRRLRPVRRHRRGRARYCRQPGLPDRAPHDGLQGISGAVRRRDREGRQYRPDVRPPLDRAELVPEGIAALHLHQGRRHRFQARAARRGLRHQIAAAHHQPVQAGRRCSRK